MKTSTHCMWGYQSQFRSSQELHATRLFQSLDPRFNPDLFLVGVLEEKCEDRFPRCVEPENNYWAVAEDFSKVSAIAQRIITGYPENKLINSLHLAQQREDNYLYKRSIRDAIKQIVDNHPNKPRNMSYSVSMPAMVDCYWVSVVIGLQENVINSHYALLKSELELHEYLRIRIPVSLIDATMLEFLEYTATELIKPNPGGEPGNILKIEDMTRAAGDSFISGIVWRVDQDCFYGICELFRSCNIISSMFYEKSVGVGNILLAKKNQKNLYGELKFASPVRLSNYREARKLLQLASTELKLHSDSEKIYGLTSVSNYNEENEELFEIVFQGHHYWELSHSGRSLMGVKYGQPFLPKQSFDEQKLSDSLARIFNGISNTQIEDIIHLVKQAEQESHGTMLVITDDAEQEAQRLKTQCTVLEPCKINPKLLRQLTPIDGAILLSPDGVCYAIGVILDGMATKKGDPGRGARYNSAIRYVETSKVPSLAVVISEDGGVDLI